MILTNWTLHTPVEIWSFKSRAMIHYQWPTPGAWCSKMPARLPPGPGFKPGLLMPGHPTQMTQQCVICLVKLMVAETREPDRLPPSVLYGVEAKVRATGVKICNRGSKTGPRWLFVVSL